MVLKKEGLLFAIKPVLWLPHPVGLFIFWFSYGDYSFGRALKTTVGRGAGEAAGLKDRIKHCGGGGVGVAVYKRWRNGETEVLSCSGNIPFLCCLLLFSWLKVRINNQWH